ncbi:MAG: hypothetical protein P4M14_07285 [Gammaproteobacteria bacterium]|nr:hypothetical protein [Gammaproteobacteria bacterium]
MPKSDITDLLNNKESPTPPADIELSLGKKGHRQHQKLLAENPDKTPAEIFMMLGAYLENHSRGNFGFAKIYPALFCYAMAAKTFPPSLALKSYAEIVRLVEDIIFKDDIEDARVTDAINLAQQRIDQIKSAKVELYPNLRDDLQSLVDSAYTYSDKVLAERLDAQYEIYLKCQSLLQNPKETDSNKIIYSELKQKAFDFLKVVLNVDTDKKIEESMKLRQATKHTQPEFIPNKTPVLLRSNNNGDRWQQVKDYGKAVVRGALLEVNDKAREKDKNESIVQLTAAERDGFRVHIYQGQFYARDPANDFHLFDTKKNISHGHDGMAAYVINSKGELSIFSHFGLEKPFAHSSLNSQASVYAAGEIRIENGQLKELTPYSGHYRPTNHQVLQALIYFKYQHIDISNAVVNLASFATGEEQTEAMKYNALDFFNNPQIANKPNATLGQLNQADSDERVEMSSSARADTPSSTDNWADFSDFDSVASTSQEDVESSASASVSPREFSFEDEDWADFTSLNEKESPKIYSDGQNKTTLFGAAKKVELVQNDQDDSDRIDHKFTPTRR